MNRSREALEELIERVLAGDVTAGELLEFQAELSRDPALRQRFEAQSDVFRRLSHLQPSEVPPGLHDAVMAEVLRTPRSGTIAEPVVGSGPSWWSGWAGRRLAFPAVAVAVALGLLWFAGGPPRAGSPGGSQRAGTLVRASAAGTMALGEGDAKVQVHWKRTRTGFTMRLDAGTERVEVELTALTPGTGMMTELLAGRETPVPEFHMGLPAHQHQTFLGSAPMPNATVRIRVTFADGHAVERELTITGLQEAAPNQDDKKLSEEPTSTLLMGH